MGISEELALEFRGLFPQLPLKELAAFSGNLATCLEAGLNVPDSLETCTRSSPNQLLRSTGQSAADRARDGASLPEALEPLAVHLPKFYLPVLQCGERSGRTDEALRYLQEHCSLLERPYQAMRNLWLVPLIIFVVGSVVLTTAHFFLAPFWMAVRFFFHEVMKYAVLGAVVLLVLNVPPLRRLWDQFMLVLPWIGRSVREMSVNRFLHALNLMYCTGGISFPAMVEKACLAVDNTVVRDEFLAAVPHLTNGGSLSEGLAGCPSLSADQKATIATGEESGRIEDALDTLCRQTGESLEARIRAFRAIFFRVIILVVALSLLAQVRRALVLVLPKILGWLEPLS